MSPYFWKFEIPFEAFYCVEIYYIRKFRLIKGQNLRASSEYTKACIGNVLFTVHLCTVLFLLASDNLSFLLGLHTQT